VGTEDLAPHSAELGTSDGLLGLVDERNLLAEVKLSSLGIVHALNLEERSVVVSITTSSLETDEVSLHVKSAGLYEGYNK
jgi:hypothetical protein